MGGGRGEDPRRSATFVGTRHRSRRHDESDTIRFRASCSLVIFRPRRGGSVYRGVSRFPAARICSVCRRTLTGSVLKAPG